MRRSLLFLLLAGCAGSDPAPPVPATPATKIDVAGIENVYQVTPKLLSGGSPEGDAAFKKLWELGVTTVISVDGMTPDAERASRFGMTYIHLPVGYDGINTTTAYKLARVVQLAPGSVYLHCHHGKHRGPTAIAVVRLSLEPDYTPADATAWLTQAGTDAKYAGLFRMCTHFVRPTAEQLEALPKVFPSKASLPDLTQRMVSVDEHWDAIKRTKERDWLGADAAATLLAEDFREAKRAVSASGKGDEFATQMLAAEATAKAIADAVRSNDLKAVPDLVAKAQSQCVKCHARFRD